MGKKLTYNYVKDYIESFGYTLLSSDYKGIKHKLEIMCPKGHIYFACYNNFQQGKRCPVCNYEEKSKKYLIDSNIIKEKIEYYGYKLLSDYKGCNKKLSLMCPEGHIYKTRWSQWERGQRCPECQKIKSTKNRMLSYNKIKDYIESFGYTLISKEYKGQREKMEVLCPEGHIYKVNWGDFKGGSRCPICSGKKKYTYNEVKDYIESFGYQLLSKEYKNVKSKLKIKCPYGHIYDVTFGNFKSGKRCPICNAYNYSSKAEKEIQEFIEKNYKGKISKNNRKTILNPLTGYYLELDIYLPELNKAIEFNGEYWHSKEKACLYDKIKKEECKKLGIEILIINEKEWLENKEKELDKIFSFIQR